MYLYLALCVTGELFPISVTVLYTQIGIALSLSDRHTPKLTVRPF